MTHACCPDCRLRFTPAAAAYLPACPRCGESMRQLDRLATAVGWQLFKLDDETGPLPEAISVALPIDDPRPRHS